MTLQEAIKNSHIIRRKSSTAHKGSHGTGWVDFYSLISCCSSHCGTFGAPCSKPHLTEDDILADDWEYRD